jgi:hypothetical protein
MVQNISWEWLTQGFKIELEIQDKALWVTRRSPIMRTYIVGILGLFIMIIMALVMIVGCHPRATSPSPETVATSLSSTYPIEIVSVLDTYEAGQTVNPAGPEIEITLKNVSDKSIVSLNVTLLESGERSFDFDFYVTSSHPLIPNKNIGSKRSLIGGGWGDSIPYSLVINGTMASGETFSFTWKPSDQER